MKIREDGTISHSGKIETYNEFGAKVKDKKYYGGYIKLKGSEHADN